MFNKFRSKCLPNMEFCPAWRHERTSGFDTENQQTWKEEREGGPWCFRWAWGQIENIRADPNNRFHGQVFLDFNKHKQISLLSLCMLRSNVDCRGACAHVRINIIVSIRSGWLNGRLDGVGSVWLGWLVGDGWLVGRNTHGHMRTNAHQHQS
jgi:hypothetical protein